MIVTVRFSLEIFTVGGLIFGSFRADKLSGKIIYLSLAVFIVAVWMLLGAPKSTYHLAGINKILLESGIFLIGGVAYSWIFNKEIGYVYFTVVVIDTVLLHFLKL